MYTKTNFGFMPRTAGGFMDDIFFNGFNRVNEEMTKQSIPVNIKETATDFELYVVAPGLKKDDFRINVDKNNLTISYNHKDEQQEKNEKNESEKWLRSEYKTRSFKRTFTLTDKIDTGKIAAKYADGILTVTLAKKEINEPAPQEIAVN